MGEVIGRALAGALRLAWVRCGSELYLPCALGFPCPSFWPLSVFSQFPFFFLSQAIPYKLDIRISVFISPVCINALGLRESLSRLGLHNNALSLRESTSQLGLHKMPLVCVNPCHDLVCITMPLVCLCLLSWTLIQHDCQVCPFFLSSVWLPSGLLNPDPGRLPAASYK